MLFGLVFALAVHAEPPPSAREILETVRWQQAQQQIDLQGQLRQNDLIVPFHLIQSGAVVRYIFSNPEEALQLQFGENDSRLDEISREGVEKVTPAQFDHKIRGTDVTYEDLSSDSFIGRIPKSWAPITFAAGTAGSCNCARPRANHSTRPFFSGWTRQAARSCAWKDTMRPVV